MESVLLSPPFKKIIIVDTQIINPQKSLLNFENKSKDNLLPLENNRHQNHQPVSKTSGKKLSKPKSGTSKHDDELDNLLAGTLSMQPKSQYVSI
ncbi:hypothetical protein KQX54_011736 [Cotesia glomerata]|uniref:Uncharacterized protein n=1 Tax=Cotesia glomerata TaxID=32391 RepID=A0AAV7IKV3_COTGL|nr:hypothetical protein KQX54_011736 [Cotesia glomerata]